MFIRVLLSSVLLMTALTFAGCGNKPLELTLPSPDSSNSTDTARPQP
ncbi:hypothetical protein [Reinekea sp.]|jgi:predicted small lipoprotein YifL|nr:hypothetical protein [Reinekea sp.]